jgi:uncharacterized membrane protein (DUF4010 family)
MNELDLLTRLSVSLAIGLLVGLERGWRTREADDHQRAAGFRTFALSGLLGGIAGAVSLTAGGVVVGFVFLGYACVFGAFHWLEARADNQFSVTSVVAGLLTFLLGCFAVVGHLQLAVAGGVAMTIVLALREQMHRWVASLNWDEIRATLTLLAMTFLLLPVLPDRNVDPWGAVNPHQVWLLAIFIAAISFGGYVGVRVLGQRLGVVMAAIGGGLASSTATTLTLARMGREHPGASRLLAAGVLLSGVVMIVRVAVLAGVLNSMLLPTLAPPLGAGGLVMLGASLALLFFNRETRHPQLEITNPLQIGMALKMAAFIAAVLIAAKVIVGLAGDAGVLIVAALSGLADVDAVTISMARLGGEDIGVPVAVQAILAVVAVNTLTKAVLALYAGGVRLGAIVGAASLLAVAAGAGVVFWTI